MNNFIMIMLQFTREWLCCCKKNKHPFWHTRKLNELDNILSFNNKVLNANRQTWWFLDSFLSHFPKNECCQKLTRLWGSQIPLFFLSWGLTTMIKCPGVGQLFSTASIAVATSWAVASGLRESITDCTSLWERQQTCNCSLSFRRISLGRSTLSIKVKSCHDYEYK